MEKFKIGDLVRLKSGSPIMTVGGYRDNNIIVCVFFSEQKQEFIKTDFFAQSIVFAE
ncbi:DUF2158 domain-containing protein [Myroides odoratus]|uniref:YodC family protein n=1 Tax=Myroides odoratus TaxID=256 RepID=UPI00333EF28F